MGLSVNQATLPQPQPLPQLEQSGELQGREVVVETGDTKSASFFRKAASAFGAFVVASAKFVFKTALFVTGITPLLYITLFFLSRLNPKQEAPTNMELATKENITPPTRKSVSEKEVDERCDGLNNFHASEREAPVDDLGSQDEINAQLRADIEYSMQRIDAVSNETSTASAAPEATKKKGRSKPKAPVAPVVSEEGLRRSGRVRTAPQRYGH